MVYSCSTRSFSWVISCVCTWRPCWWSAAVQRGPLSEWYADSSPIWRADSVNLLKVVFQLSDQLTLYLKGVLMVCSCSTWSSSWAISWLCFVHCWVFESRSDLSSLKELLYCIFNGGNKNQLSKFFTISFISSHLYFSDISLFIKSEHGVLRLEHLAPLQYQYLQWSRVLNKEVVDWSTLLLYIIKTSSVQES